ncbi:MAG TPA: PEGA domain-containing protein [Anaeromyxobacter sp.]|nr:PEGA domain-containing protein [Anaeromyxobacter sp.]
MMEPDHRSAVRRIALRAAFAVIPLIVLALAAPRLLAWVKGGDLTGLGDRTVRRPTDRPPTDEELRAARTAERKLAETQEKWRDGTAIAPSETERDTAGEEVRWFQGFGVSVESTPGGAQVLVDGQDMGRTPLVASVPCDPGDEVRVEVRMPPRPPQQRTTRCRNDQLVELRFELK